MKTATEPRTVPPHHHQAGECQTTGEFYLTSEYVQTEAGIELGKVTLFAGANRYALDWRDLTDDQLKTLTRDCEDHAAEMRSKWAIEREQGRRDP